MTTPQKLLLTWALLIMGSCGHKSDAQTNLSDVNDQIALTRTNIRAIRDANRRGIARTLDRNSDYKYTVENRTRVDSLRRYYPTRMPVCARHRGIYHCTEQFHGLSPIFPHPVRSQFAHLIRIEPGRH